MNEFFEITCPITGQDATLFTAVVNQGIDAHLEAFTKSKFSYKGPRLVLSFHVSELPILVRRLEELDDPEADHWAQDIRDTEEFKKENEK